MTRNKLFTILIMLFFAFMALYSAWNDLRGDQQLLQNINLVENRLNDVAKLNSVITQLQKERGLTAIYRANINENTLSALTLQREQTTATLSSSYTTPLIKKTLLERADLVRTIDHGTVTAEKIFDSYSAMIMTLMQESENLIFETRDADLKNLLIVYHLLKNAQESTGRIRAIVGVTLASKELSDKNHQKIIALDAIYHNLINKSYRHMPARFQHLINTFKMVPCVNQTFDVVQNIKNKTIDKVTLTPSEWFERSTCTIEHLNALGNEQLIQLETEVSMARKLADKNLITHLIFWSGGLMMLLILLIIIIKSSKALSHKHHLLENYKEAIDYSTIVSKADKNGIITYVNNAFCEVSGYSEAELLQQPHNIVRHPDMSAEVFQEMWYELKEGNKWKGILKNLKKDGTSYWVDASISPIFDDKGNLVEYIAIRRDVTDIILLNEEIKETQSELIYLMGEAVESRSKENGHHVQRVAYYSKLLAQLAGLEHEECEIIFSASTMHDVGKLSIPDAILLKSDALNDEEWAVMKTHAEIGYKILGSSNRPLLKMAATVAYEHHEHFDGKGYPRGLKADEISIYGRIVAVADVFDALGTDRIYKKAWTIEDILDHLLEHSGKQFDPWLIDLLIENLDQFLAIKDKFNDE